MRYFLLMIAVVVVVGCGQPAVTREEAEKEEAEAKTAAEAKAKTVIEKAIRKQLNKPEGKLTKADYEKVWTLTPEFTFTRPSEFRGVLTDKDLESRVGKAVLNPDGTVTITRGLAPSMESSEKGNENEPVNLKDLEVLTNLQTLDLRKLRSPGPTQFIGEMPSLQKLSTLCLNELFSVQWWKLPQLKVLRVGNDASDGARAFWISLQIGVGGHGYVADNKLDVTGLGKLTQLTELYLEGKQLAGVKGLEKLTQLTKLSLGYNYLTDVTGLEKLTQLTELNLGYNELAKLPEGLEKLMQLEVLNLDNNPDLTKAQIDELQKALPKCSISHDFKK